MNQLILYINSFRGAFMKKIFLAVCVLFAFKNFIAADSQPSQGAWLVVFAVGKAETDRHKALLSETRVA